MIENPVPWPNGARCACCVSFDMDADSLVHVAHPLDGHTRVAAISMLRYGPEVAVGRILNSYAELGIRQTFFVPAWCIEQYPKAVDAILRGGHEIGHHGYIHEHPRELGKDEEAYWLDRGIEVILRHTGRKPAGWRAPLYNFSHHSAELLVDRAFSYDASLMGDDVPYFLDCAHGSLVEIPSHWGLDDWPQFVQSIDLDYMMPIRSPDTGIEIFRTGVPRGLSEPGTVGSSGPSVCNGAPLPLGGHARLPVGDPHEGRCLVRANAGDCRSCPGRDGFRRVRAEA